MAYVLASSPDAVTLVHHTVGMETDYLPISKINTLVYCPRRFYLEFLLLETHQNEHVIEGQYLHERAYTEPGERSRVWVWSDRLRIVGIIDRLEYRAGQPVVVEYKLGRAREEAHESDAVQLAAQAVALAESHGIEAREGYIYYHGSRTRRPVEFTAELSTHVERAVAWMRDLSSMPRPPPVEVRPAKCRGCSVHEACQPELWRHGRTAREKG